MKNNVKFLWLILTVLALPVYANGAQSIQALRKMHERNAEILSIDIPTEEISYRNAEGQTKEVVVATTALATLSTLRVGDHRDLILEIDPEGEPLSVVAFKPVKSARK